MRGGAGIRPYMGGAGRALSSLQVEAPGQRFKLQGGETCAGEAAGRTVSLDASWGGIQSGLSLSVRPPLSHVPTPASIFPLVKWAQGSGLPRAVYAAAQRGSRPGPGRARRGEGEAAAAARPAAPASAPEGGAALGGDRGGAVPVAAGRPLARRPPPPPPPLTRISAPRFPPRRVPARRWQPTRCTRRRRWRR